MQQMFVMLCLSNACGYMIPQGNFAAPGPPAVEELANTRTAQAAMVRLADHVSRAESSAGFPKGPWQLVSSLLGAISVKSYVIQLTPTSGQRLISRQDCEMHVWRKTGC